MQLSAEVRWFWKGNRRQELTPWFKTSKYPVSGGEVPRSDTYICDGVQAELGLKARGEKPGIEVKALVAERSSPLAFGGLLATVQLWTKVTSMALSLGTLQSVTTHKTRWLRKFDTANSEIEELRLDEKEEPIGRPRPDDGCSVELTLVTLDTTQEVWTTVGFEAFGAMDRVEASLARIVKEVTSPAFPQLGPAQALSYPAWLAKHACGVSGARG